MILVRTLDVGLHLAGLALKWTGDDEGEGCESRVTDLEEIFLGCSIGQNNRNLTSDCPGRVSVCFCRNHLRPLGHCYQISSVVINLSR